MSRRQGNKLQHACQTTAVVCAHRCFPRNDSIRTAADGAVVVRLTSAVACTSYSIICVAPRSSKRPLWQGLCQQADLTGERVQTLRNRNVDMELWKGDGTAQDRTWSNEHATNRTSGMSTERFTQFVKGRHHITMFDLCWFSGDLIQGQ